MRGGSRTGSTDDADEDRGHRYGSNYGSVNDSEPPLSPLRLSHSSRYRGNGAVSRTAMRDTAPFRR